MSEGGTRSSEGAGSAQGPTTGYQRYVALGDSYSAGPLIPTTDLAGGCARSDHNYPSLVAAELGVTDFVDVTCSGATTRDLTSAQRPFRDARVPPQLRSVTRRTDLVTLGIGGNDFGLFGRVLGTCTRLRTSDPAGSPCARELAARGPDLAAATRVIGSRLTAALRAIRTRAPQAVVLLVGYPRLVPDQGSCADLPLATGDYAEARRIGRALDRALAGAADRARVSFVDLYEASRGHDICSGDPWVNGRVTDRQRALAYHPLASGMRAAADGVLAALPSRSASGGRG
jgi:lysophospholipase L1-like esterase